MQDVNNRGNWEWGIGEHIGTLYFRLNFSVDLKLLLKKSLFIKKEKFKILTIGEIADSQRKHMLNTVS